MESITLPPQPKTKMISTRLSPEMISAVRSAARIEGHRNASDFLRRLINEYFDKPFQGVLDE